MPEQRFIPVFSLPQVPTRTEVLTFISKSASYGNLGLFVGAGFSMAVLNDPMMAMEIALSRGELLKRATKKLNVDYDEINKVGVGYPEIASAICKTHSNAVAGKYESSLSELKREIAALTAWYPDQRQRNIFSDYLQNLSPAWIITTNYDLVIESLLTGRSMPLGPNDSLSSPKGLVPVFHLHGRRTNPDEIIIAQEDYVTLFRPTEYRQIKLALTIKAEQQPYPSGVIQVLRKDTLFRVPEMPVCLKGYSAVTSRSASLC
jgi:hypothetical protein